MMTARDVPLADVQFDEQLYPRKGFDQEIVARYRLAGDHLPPITITHEGWLIDGYHRLLAARLEGRETIAAVVETLPREQVLWEAAVRNATHGHQLDMAEKRKAARRFCSDGHDLQAIAGALSVCYSTVRDWTRELRQQQDDARDQRILDLWLACQTQREIAEAVGLSLGAVNATLDTFRNSESANPEHPPDSLQLFNVWQFGECDERYGVATFPGRIPGQIVENLLYYYTEPFDLVVDPCAGSGTTLDVCRQMRRRYRGYDLRPLREPIAAHDITTGFPRETRGCTLIVLDPPYWQQKQGEYSDDPTNLANLPLEQFDATLAQVSGHGGDMLASGGHLAVIIGPTQRAGIVYDHAVTLAQTLAGIHSLTLRQRVIVLYTTQQARGYDVAAAKAGRFMLKLYRDVLIYQKHG